MDLQKLGLNYWRSVVGEEPSSVTELNQQVRSGLMICTVRTWRDIIMPASCRGLFNTRTDFTDLLSI
ncbi:hypothetical protein CR513_16249, partial [Mucuna pruriens]